MNPNRPGDEAKESGLSTAGRGGDNDSSETSGALGDEHVEFDELMKRAPAPVRALLMEMTRTQFTGPGPYPLFDKFTPEHVDKFLDYSHQDDQNAYALAASNRWFYLAYVFVVVAFLVFLIVYLAPNNKDLLVEILKIIGYFGGGFGAGFGVKSYLERRG